MFAPRGPRALLLRSRGRAAKTGWRAHCVEGDWFTVHAITALLRSLHVVSTSVSAAAIAQRLRESHIEIVHDSDSGSESKLEGGAGEAESASAAELSLLETVADKVAVIRRLRRCTRHATRTAKDRMTLLQGASLSQQHEWFRGRAKRYFCVRGGFTLVIRRILGGLSSRRTGVTLGVDVDGTTVNRWEMLFHASLVASVRRWYQERENALQEPLPADARSRHSGTRHISTKEMQRTPWFGKKPRFIQLRSPARISWRV